MRLGNKNVVMYYSLSVRVNLGKHFVVPLVTRLWQKGRHKRYYLSTRTTFRSASFKTHFEEKLFQMDNASCASLFTWDA